VNIYLDIDGPLIRNGQVAAHCFVFLRWAVKFHRPYWLTTRDAHGTHDGILRAYRHALGTPNLPAEIETLIRAVKPTRWRGSKLDAIDLASNWVWIDDDPLLADVETLRCRGLLDRLLNVDSDCRSYRRVHPALNRAARLLAVRRPLRRSGGRHA
jgi:hypothetical protein